MCFRWTVLNFGTCLRLHSGGDSTYETCFGPICFLNFAVRIGIGTLPEKIVPQTIEIQGGTLRWYPLRPGTQLTRLGHVGKPGLAQADIVEVTTHSSNLITYRVILYYDMYMHTSYRIMNTWQKPTEYSHLQRLKYIWLLLVPPSRPVETRWDPLRPVETRWDPGTHALGMSASQVLPRRIY